MGDLLSKISALIKEIDARDGAEKIQAINDARTAINSVSPFKDEPVDLVLWVPTDDVIANDYNPNTVAPPEMLLLEESVSLDGYTQPVVSFEEGGKLTVVDGFHRSRVGKESVRVQKRTGGYLPITKINSERGAVADRMASTVRHNRARGKHGIAAMSEIILDVTRRNWSDQKICQEFGMDLDEVRALRMTVGLEDAFANQEFSEAWEIDKDALHG